MSDIHHLPAIKDVEEQASQWIARLQADDVTADDRARFEAWRSAHPLHARTYDEVRVTWQQLIAAGRTVRAVSFGNAMQAGTRRRKRRWPGVFAAAAMLACVMVAAWWRLQTPTSFETGIGEHASVVLSDGSRMELNSNSAVVVDYRRNARLINLERGEAYFTVAHDRARPFWVSAGQTWVRAVGTAFNVYRREDGVRVTVDEGVVKVTAAPAGRAQPSDEALAKLPVSVLGIGQQADLRSGSTQLRRLPPPEVERETAWRSGTIHFENRPLYEVVEEMSRYTPLQIELGAGARDLPIGGAFQTNPQGAEALLGMLHDGLGLTVRRESTGRVHVE